LERLYVHQFMSTPVITITADCPMEDAARIMVQRKIGCLPVMEVDALLGIITETDILKTFVDVLGGNEKRIRITLQVPERIGTLAEITKRIAAAQGNILALTTSSGQKNSQSEVTIKIVGADSDALVTQLKGSGARVLDLRTNVNVEPRLFGT